MDARPHRRYCECRNDFGVPITAGARVDDCAHDNAHRHGRRLGRLRERTAGQQHRGLQRLLFSRTMIVTARCLTGSRPEGCGLRLSTARQRRRGLGLATRRCAAERPAWSGGRRQLQFGLHLCHTQLVLLVLYVWYACSLCSACRPGSQAQPTSRLCHGAGTGHDQDFWPGCWGRR